MRSGAAITCGVALLCGAARGRATSGESADGLLRAHVVLAADSLDASLVALERAYVAASADSTTLPRVVAATRTARARFKRIEGVIEFYAPALAASFNARRQEIDDDDAPSPSSTAPTGFPALESIAGHGSTVARADSALVVVRQMRLFSSRLRTLAPALVPSEAQVIEIARLELARIETLGIAGFDAPRSGQAMRESAEAIAGIRTVILAVGPTYWPAFGLEREAVDSTLARAGDYLIAHPDFERFDRLAFLIGYAEPALRAVDELRRAAAVTPIRIQRAWRADVASPFMADAFDASAYAPSGTPRRTSALVALGARLFSEPALSGNGSRSCASCHQPRRDFTDGRVTPLSMRRDVPVARNTPTLLNAALQPAQFADERSVTLEDQILTVLASPAEMGSSITHAVSALRATKGYDSAFAHTFAGSETPITERRLQQALAAYERTLVALNSRFDRAVRGDTAALSRKERHGFTLFMGKAGCGTCHFAPLFNGTMPPRYLSSDVEVIGTPASAKTLASPDADSGRARIDRLDIHYRSFKTPSLRNSTHTAPYMHNGVFGTLDDVMRFYEAGGALGAGARIENQTLAADSLHLTIADRRAIIAFLGALSDARVGWHQI